MSAVDDADTLLRAFDRLIAEGRSDARTRLEERLRGRADRVQRAREEDAQRARILGEAPGNEVLLNELHKARAEGDTERAHTLERMINGVQDATPAILDPDAKARARQEALDKRERERAGMAPPAPVERKPNDYALDLAALKARKAAKEAAPEALAEE